MKGFVRVCLALLVLAALGGGGWWYWQSELAGAGPGGGASARAPAAPGGGAPRGIPVDVRPVEVRTVAQTITVVGTLLSNESIVVRPEIAGRIVQISFEEGQPVERGQPLVAIDAAVLQAAVDEARASLLLSQRNSERTQELFQRGATTARQRDETQAQLTVDEARLQLAEARLRQTRVVAPFAGVLGLRQVSIGDYVQPGQDIVNLENIDPIKVEFRVAEVSFGALASGQKLLVAVDAFPGESFPGTVYAIDPKLDAGGRSVAIRARLPNPERRLRPGMFARVQLTVAERPEAVLVPESAIVPRGQEQFVFRVVEGKAQLVRVALGLRRDGWVEITDGLGPADRVVAAGHEKLRDGAPVAPVAAGS